MLALFFLLGCADEIQEVTIGGVGGVPELTWTGADAETVRFTSVDGSLIWNLLPEEALCSNPLSGRRGVLWGELPNGYDSLDEEGDPLEATDALEDGSYSVRVGVCVSGDADAPSYSSRGASFIITDGVVSQLLLE